MAQLTSILGTDLISNSYPVINTNFQNLNAGKVGVSSVLANGLATITDGQTLTPIASTGTSGQVLTSQGTSQPIWSSFTTPSVTSMIPKASGVLNQVNNNSIGITSGNPGENTMNLLKVDVPFNITVNTISNHIQSVWTWGQIVTSLYDESGTTRVASVVTQVSVLGVNTMNVVPSVLLTAGSYYLGVNTVSSCTATMTAQQLVGADYLRSSVLSQPVYLGNTSIVSGAPPSSIITTNIKPSGLLGGYIRLN